MSRMFVKDPISRMSHGWNVPCENVPCLEYSIMRMSHVENSPMAHIFNVKNVPLYDYLILKMSYFENVNSVVCRECLVLQMSRIWEILF